MEEVKLERKRTEMADERTLLAYVRTALNIFIFGFVAHRLYLESIWGVVLLYISIVSGIILLIIGVFRFSFYEKGLEKKF
jgi:putative membrane protein